MSAVGPAEQPMRSLLPSFFTSLTYFLLSKGPIQPPNLHQSLPFHLRSPTPCMAHPVGPLFTCQHMPFLSQNTILNWYCDVSTRILLERESVGTGLGRFMRFHEIDDSLPRCCLPPGKLLRADLPSLRRYGPQASSIALGMRMGSLLGDHRHTGALIGLVIVAT